VKYFVSYCFFLFFTFTVSAQQYTDAIIGKWKSEDQKTIVEIYKTGSTFSGKIVWQQNPNDANGNPRKDTENPDAAKRSRLLMGLLVLYHLKFEEGYWQDGEIYNSQNGETYDVDVWLEGNDILKLKIYFYFIHETQSWTRVK
jgi:uncharacterized protein (DUF2147 family)